MRLILITPLCFLLTACSHQYDEARLWENLYLQANRAKESHDYARAVALYTGALARAETFKAPDVRLGLTLDRLAMVEIFETHKEQAASLLGRALATYDLLQRRNRSDDFVIK